MVMLTRMHACLQRFIFWSLIFTLCCKYSYIAHRGAWVRMVVVMVMVEGYVVVAGTLAVVVAAEGGVGRGEGGGGISICFSSHSCHSIGKFSVDVWLGSQSVCLSIFLSLCPSIFNPSTYLAVCFFIFFFFFFYVFLFFFVGSVHLFLSV